MRKIGIVIVAMMILLMSVFVFADEGEQKKILSYAIGGYTGDETNLFSPTNSEARGVEKFEISERSLSVFGEVEEVRRRRSNNIIMACAYTPDEYGGGEGLTVSLDLTEKMIRLNDYATFAFGVGIIGGFENNDAYSVHIELITSDDTFRTDLTVEEISTEKGWYMVYLDLSEVYGYAEVLNVTFSFDGDTMPEQVRVSTPFVRVRAPEAFDIAEHYSAGSLVAIDGRLGHELGVIIPNEHGEAVIKGRIATSEELVTGSVAYFRVEIEGISSGRLTFALEYTDPNKHGKFVSRTVNIDGETVFTIPVKINGEVLSYTLMFDDIECEESFKLSSVMIYGNGMAGVSALDGLCSLNTIERIGDSVKFSGTLERDAAKAYSDASIGFFALPGNSRGDIESAVELGRIKVSTRFEYTVNLASYHVSADTHTFMAAIVYGDSILPISYPRYCDAYEAEQERLSPVGLCGAAPAGAFESNVSHIIVDVPLDKLYDRNGRNGAYSLSYSLYDVSNKQSQTVSVNLSKELVEELDRDVNFYISVGVKVYLRLVSSKPIDGLTYGGEADNYAVCLDNDEARSLYASTVRFLSSRYGDIAGFVVGRAVNNIISVGNCTEKSLREYAFDLSELCRITYNAASGVHNGITVLVPFDERRNEEEYLPIRVLGTMIADELDRGGAMPWSILYCVDDEGDDVNVPDGLISMLEDLDIAIPRSVMIYYEPDMGDIVKSYLENGYEDGDSMDYELAYTRYAVQTFTRLISRCNYADVVFMSLGSTTLRNDRNFYSILKDSSELGGFIYESAAVSDDANPESSFVGKYTIWDFSDKHYAQGWLGGGGIASCLTGYSKVADGKYTRVLKTQLVSDEYGGAGVALCDFKNTLDMSQVDRLKFTFAITRDDGEAPTSDVAVVFVVGSDDYRAEYYAENICYGNMQTLHCDLSGYESRGAVDYIGVMIYADEDVTFELLSADAYSLGLTDGELESLFVGVAEDEKEPISYTAVAIVAVLAVSLTFIVIILLVRRDREEKEAAERERLQSEAKNKRRSYER